jgi:hypothetical protein
MTISDGASQPKKGAACVTPLRKHLEGARPNATRIVPSIAATDLSRSKLDKISEIRGVIERHSHQDGNESGASGSHVSGKPVFKNLAQPFTR